MEASMSVCISKYLVRYSVVSMSVWLGLFAVFVDLMIRTSLAEENRGLCRITVLDKATDQPVPLVELRTTNQLRFVTDNAGVIAFDAVEFMNRETWFDVLGHGYEVPADGFGMRGIRIKPQPEMSITVKVERKNIAQRLGRLTGNGLFSESQKLGEFVDWKESTIVGCDTVQMTEYRGRAFWNWGDTTLARYPLGNFHMTGAYTDLDPFASLEFPIRPRFEYLFKPDGSPKPMAPIAGSGPTWLTGYISLKDSAHREHLVACYRKIKPPLDSYEIGLCEWQDEKQEFQGTQVLWNASEKTPAPTRVPEGHPVRWTDKEGRNWILFGNPFPSLRCRDAFEAWRDPSSWELLEIQKELTSATSSEVVKPHTGSIAWNAFRQRWVTVFMQHFGKPSAFGELWYAESDSPLGPWGPTVKILSHDNYTFYNPRLHGDFSSNDSPVLLFEGTYTHTFANKPQPTPRYDYNQILYRLDLDDARLSPVQKIKN